MLHLGVIAEIFQSPPVKRYQNLVTGSSYPLIQSSDLANLRIEAINEKVLLNPVKAQKYLAKQGDIILSTRSSNPRASLYCLAEPGFPTQNLCVLRTTAEVSAAYLAALFRADYGQQILKAVQHGSVQPMLSVDALRNLKIPLPDSEVQANLIALYEAYEQTEAATKAMLNARRDLFEGVFSCAVMEAG